MKNIDKIIKETTSKLLLEYIEINETTEAFCNYLLKVILYMKQNNLSSYLVTYNWINFYDLSKYGIYGLFIKVLEDVNYVAAMNTSDLTFPTLIINKKFFTKNISNDIIKTDIIHEITHLLDRFEKEYVYYKDYDNDSFLKIKNIGHQILYLFDPTEINARLNESYYDIKDNIQYYFQNQDIIIPTILYYGSYKDMKYYLNKLSRDNYMLYKLSLLNKKPYSIVYYLLQSKPYFDLKTNEFPSNITQFLSIKKQIYNYLYNELINMPKDAEKIKNKILNQFSNQK